MQQSPRSYAERHPIATFVLLYIGMMMTYVFVGALATVGGWSPAHQGIFSSCAVLVLALVVLVRHEWWQEIGLARMDNASGWLIVWLPFLAALTPVTDGIKVTDSQELLTLLAMAVLVGLAEEVYFRGLFMRLLQPAGRKAMLLWPTLVYGLSHSLNLLAGQYSLFTFLQIANAIAFGFLLAVLRLRLKSLWPLIAAHAFMGFSTAVSQGGVRAEVVVTTAMLVVPAILTVAYVVNGVRLLRQPAEQGAR